MRQAVLVALGIVLLMSLVVVGCRLTTTKHLKVGMTEAEVEEVLGGKGVTVRELTEGEAPAGAAMKAWPRARVLFDGGGKVVGSITGE